MEMIKQIHHVVRFSMGEYASMEPQLAQWPCTSVTMDSYQQGQEALSGHVGVMDFGREIYHLVMLQVMVPEIKIACLHLYRSCNNNLPVTMIGNLALIGMDVVAYIIISSFPFL